MNGTRKHFIGALLLNVAASLLPIFTKNNSWSVLVEPLTVICIMASIGSVYYGAKKVSFEK